MLEVFSHKEYQADAVNISHIHLLEIFCQLSELFDLIRNNVVDIIKPEEVDDLIKEGIIENKDGAIKVQLDGLTYLIGSRYIWKIDLPCEKLLEVRRE